MTLSRLSIFLALLALCVNTSSVVYWGNCTDAAENTTCIVANTTLQFGSSTLLSSNASVIMNGSTIIMTTGCFANPGCQLQFNVLGNFTLIDSTIKGPWIEVNSSHLRVDNASEITTSGQGRNSNSSVDGVNGGGGGHGGTGGSGCDSVNSRGGQAIQDSALTPSSMGGRGGGPCTNSYGGGIIHIIVDGNFYLYGKVTADGGVPTNTSTATYPCGGGAGGSIYIELPSGSLSGSNGATVSAEGGKGIFSGGGGGGGRVSITNIDSTGVKISTLGGIVGDAISTATCEQGGGGTYYDGKLTSGRTTLYCQGPSYSDTNLINAVTPIPFNFTAQSLILTYCFLFSGSDTIYFPGSMELTRSRVWSTSNGAGTITINGGTLTATQYSEFIADEINIKVISFLLDSTSTVKFNKDALLNANGYIDLEGKLGEPDNPSFSTYLTMYAGTNITIGATQIHSHFVYMQTQLIQIAGNVQSTSFGPTMCSATYNLPNCSLMPPISSMFGIWMSSDVITVTAAGSVKAASAMLCASNITVSGSISGSALGCSPGKGNGTGDSITGTPAGGAGHGGKGGDGMEGTTHNKGGVIYDNPSNPTTAGSGGGSETYGGAGGGIIVMRASDTLHLTSTGTVEVAGQDGRGPAANALGDGGGGGGSGGTLRLEVTNLYGSSGASGYLSVAGGLGGFPGGGGGGGGIFLVTWLSSTINPKNLSYPLPRVYSKGGDGGLTDGVDIPNGGNGQVGVALSEPACNPGQEGVFCLPCNPGTYQSNASYYPCAPCPSGKHAQNSASTACSNCSAGTFAPSGQANCSNCPSGTFSTSGSGSCTQCNGGYFSRAEADACIPCNPGYYSGPGASMCSQCDAGYYSEQNATTCSTCVDKPLHSDYILGDSCAYECQAGYVWPACKTPFDNTMDSLGGPLAFYLILAGMVCLTSSPFIWCWLTQRKKRKIKEQAEVEEVTRLNQQRVDHGSITAANFAYSLQATGKNGTPNRYSRLDPTGLLDKERRMQDTFITSEELRYHYHRVYFMGYNHFNYPLHLSPSPDDEISNIVLPKEYREFAESIAEEWHPWEKFIYYLLCIGYYPLAHVFLHSRRIHHIEQLWKFYISYEHSFFKDYHARALGDSLKFGRAMDHSLVWVDILVRQRREDMGSHPVGKPSLPIVLVASGDGDFFSPFHLDVTDPLVKCLSVYFGRNWHKFVCALNCYLRTVTLEEIYNPSTWKNTLDFVSRMDRAGIGIGNRMPRGEVRIEMGLVGVGVASYRQAIPRHSESLFEGGNTTWAGIGPRWSVAESMRMSEGQRLTFSSQTSEAVPKLMINSINEGGDSLHRNSSGPRLSQTSDAGRLSLSTGTEPTVVMHSGSAPSMTGVPEWALESNLDNPEFKTESWRHRRFGHTPRPALILTTREVTPALRFLPYGAMPIRLILDDPKEGCGRCVAAVAPSCRDLFSGRIASFFLVNMRKKGRSLVTGSVLMFLLLAHVTGYLVLGMNYAQVVPLDFLLILLIFPLVPLFVPLFGFTAMVSSSIELCRFFAALNFLALINGFLALMSGLCGDGSRKLGLYDGTVVPAVVTVVDFCLIVITNRYIAHLEYSRETSLSRRDYLYDKFKERGHGGTNAYGSINTEEDTFYDASINDQPITSANARHVSGENKFPSENDRPDDDLTSYASYSPNTERGLMSPPNTSTPELLQQQQQTIQTASLKPTSPQQPSRKSSQNIDLRDEQYPGQSQEEEEQRSLLHHPALSPDKRSHRKGGGGGGGGMYGTGGTYGTSGTESETDDPDDNKPSYKLYDGQLANKNEILSPEYDNPTYHFKPSNRLHRNDSEDDEDNRGVRGGLHDEYQGGGLGGDQGGVGDYGGGTDSEAEDENQNNNNTQFVSTLPRIESNDLDFSRSLLGSGSYLKRREDDYDTTGSGGSGGSGGNGELGGSGGMVSFGRRPSR